MNSMSHLAAMSSPLGGFWNFSRNTNIAELTNYVHPINIYCMQFKRYKLKLTITAPLTWFPLLKFDSLVAPKAARVSGFSYSC